MRTPIFVLSLRQSLDRRKRISERLSHLGLQFSFFDAIPTSELTSSQWAPLIDRAGAVRKAGKQMTEEEFSCALSHAMIYRKIVDEGHEHAFILEDDAILPDEFETFLSDRVFEQSGENLVSFYHTSALVMKKPHKFAGSGYVLRKLVLPCDHTTGYYLSRRGARFMWKNSIPIREVADWGADIARIGAKVISPCLIGHPPEDSVRSNISNREIAKRPSKMLKRLGRRYFRYKMRKRFSEWIFSGA